MTESNFQLIVNTETTVPEGLVELNVNPVDPNIDINAYEFDWKSKTGTCQPQGKPSTIWAAPSTTGEQEVWVVITAKTKKAKKTMPDPKTLRTTIRVIATGQFIGDEIGRAADVVKEGLSDPRTRLETQLPELGPDKALWALIRNRANAISFEKYKAFIDDVICGEKAPADDDPTKDVYEKAGKLRYYGSDQYDVLKQATEAFLMHETGIKLEDTKFIDPKEDKRRLPQLKATTPEEIRTELETNRKDYLEQLNADCQTLPYFKAISDKLGDLPLKPVPADSKPRECYGILKSRICPPILLELIWSYWHEEGMLVETLKRISLRFQNKRVGSGKNPLARLDIDPIRPLNNLIWGYIEDEQHRLGASRRAFEYDHHYGLSPVRTPVPKLRSADSRSKFIEAFHNLLHRCTVFYKEQANTMIVPEGFPMLNGLKEVHLLLAEGAHNQFGDLPWTARVEMLMEQWILARVETRGFLSGRLMVPDAEPWMGAVDRMKTLQEWTDVPVRHFRDLGVFGEQILLSVRYALWTEETNEARARVWAQYWKPEIQTYIDAYRVVTGVDLSKDAVNVELARSRSLPPSEHLRRRQAQRRRAS